jgi:hypothetical protein
VAPSHQEQLRAGHQNHASGSDAVGATAERCGGVPGAAEEGLWTAEHVLQAEGVETLECVRPRAERGDSRIFQSDVIIGWRDWERVRGFLFSGWTNVGVPVGASPPASKRHLRVNLRGSLPVYLNVQLDPQRRRTTIAHEAAMRSG